MVLSWSEPETRAPGTSPYLDWWAQQQDASRAGLFTQQSFRVPPQARARGLTRQSQRIVEDLYATLVPVPGHAARPGELRSEAWDVAQIAGDLPDDLPRDTVLTGIVDTGIALSHRRTRMAGGRTRLISAWQQTATHGGQAFLPFGQELYSHDIDRLIGENTPGGDRSGPTDEDGFNRAARLVEPDKPLGHRDLDFHAAHGTHVLDLAAGYDPKSTAPDRLAANRIIAVNLPPRSMHGSAGNFLALWAIFAMERIFHVADALWQVNNAAGNAPEGGYPLVINFSYGMQAGPKTGDSPLETGIRALLAAHRERYAAPARIVMPTGNENVDRCYARALIGQGTWKKLEAQPELAVPWRIHPSDHTSSFVEIWMSGMDEDSRGASAPQPPSTDYRLFVSPPGYPDLEVPRLSPGEQSDLGGIARIYCQKQGGRVSFVLAVARTASHDPGAALAPAGAWQIRLVYNGDPVNADLFIQSDQSTMPGSRTALKSYFDHPKAVPYLENGRRRDSYDYETGAPTDAWPEYGPVQIKGTQNALASSHDVNVVGGYRISDGKPEIYSSTNDGSSKQNGDGREIMDACYPSEDAPSLFGLLAAGARDGSVVAYRGTSMAAGLATRGIAGAMRGWHVAWGPPDLGDFNWIRDRAAAFQGDVTRPSHYRVPRQLKAGLGQLPYPETARSGRVRRV